MTLTQRKPLKKIFDEVEFYQHQLDGIRQMSRMTSVLLCDEMGLGKSLQALTVAAIDFERGIAHQILIICPATLKENWAEEIRTYTQFSFEILTPSSPKSRLKTLENFHSDILIINYELLAKHVDQIKSMNFDIVIYDEAHYMKNRKAVRSKACRALTAPRHLLLTGSPMLNKVNDLWALLNRVDSNSWPNYWRFENRFCLYGGYMGKEIIGVKNEKELTERLNQVMIRRYKKDCLDLPDKQYIQVIVELSDEQREMYNQAIEEMKIDLPDASSIEIENALVKFLRLKQICGTTACITDSDNSLKLDRVVEMVQEITDSGERVVLFTQFREIQRCLIDRFKDHFISSFILHGDVPAKDRVGVINNWSNTPASALIAMIQVGGVGLTMTAASKCIFVDKLFSPKMNEQAEDRLHRIGASTTQPVQIYQLITKNTIESRIEQILRQKQKVFGKIVDSDSSAWKRKLIQAVLAKEEEND